jgi:putative membrane protein
MWVTATVIIMISGCSKTERAKPPSSEQPTGYSGAVGTDGASANLRSDDDFVHDVAVKTMVAVELSRMALDKATDPNIRVFAQMMIDEHGAAGDKLKSVVSEQPFEWPAQPDEKRRKTAEELKKTKAASVADWTTATAARTQSKALPDPIAIRDVQVRPNKSDNAVTMRINQWAADTYPVAQKHLDTPRTLENAAKQRSPK